MKTIVTFLIVSFFLVSGSSAQTNQLPTGSVEENFSGGKTEFYNVFKSKVVYPAALKPEKITGNVYYKLEIDTTGHIVNFQLLKSLSPLMDKEIEQKIHLTDGKWSPCFSGEKKVNYLIVEKQYFELR